MGLDSNHQATPAWSYAKRDENEIACDIFASELLMPFEAFTRDADQTRPSFELVEHLRAKYVVSFPACASHFAAITNHSCAFVFMSSTVVRYASRSKALRELNTWVEMRVQIPPGSVAYQIIQDGQSSGEDSSISQDVWFRDWPQGYELTELAKHSPTFDETFSLLWFEPDRGPIEPVKNWTSTPSHEDEDGLKELDGILNFQKKVRRR